MLARNTLPAVGASVWAAGNHVWKGNMGTFDGKGDGKSEKDPKLKGETIVSEHCIGYIETACREIDGNDGNEEKDAAEERVNEELYRGVVLVGSSPDGNEEVHRDEHRFPENVKQDEIKRAEDADHGRFHEQDADHELLHPLLDCCPRTEHADRCKQCCKEDEEDGNPVNTEGIVDIVRWYPGDMFAELKEGRCRIKTGIEDERNGKID